MSFTDNHYKVNSFLVIHIVCVYKNVILPKPMHYVLAGLLITQTWMEDMDDHMGNKRKCMEDNYQNIYYYCSREEREEGAQDGRHEEGVQHNVDASKLESYTHKERDLRVHMAGPMLGSVCNVLVAPNRVGIG